MRLLGVVAVVSLVGLALAAPDAGRAGACPGAGGYPGDDAPRAAIAGWMAKGAMAAGLPGELPVMGALVESNLHNLNYGDADAVGYFQMRAGIWNRGPYAGFPEDPELQLRWFVDQALEVKERRVAAGNAQFGSDPARYGEWVADVLRPPEQYRYRYQQRLDDARTLMAAGCAAPADPGAAPEAPGTVADSDPAQDVTPPAIALGASGTQDVLRQRALLVAVTCQAETCRAAATGTISLPGAARTYRIAARSTVVGAGQRATLTLPLRRTVLRRVRQALERGIRVRARITVTVRDLAGNVTVTRRIVRLRARPQ